LELGWEKGKLGKLLRFRGRLLDNNVTGRKEVLGKETFVERASWLNYRLTGKVLGVLVIGNEAQEYKWFVGL
jgi:hypothetical protein